MGSVTHESGPTTARGSGKTPFEQQHTGVGLTTYLGLGLALFSLLVILLALVMIWLIGPLG